MPIRRILSTMIMIVPVLAVCGCGNSSATANKGADPAGEMKSGKDKKRGGVPTPPEVQPIK